MEQSKDASSTLTNQELQAAYLATFDLGPGYPQLPVEAYVRDLYLDDQIEELSLRFAPLWTPQKQMHVDQDLELAVRRLLDLPLSGVSSVSATFSGSIALDRAISAASNLLLQKGRGPVSVVTTTPSIDIMRLFLEERLHFRLRFVRNGSNDTIGELRKNAVVSAVLRASRSRQSKVLVILSSPENPTGESWTVGDLQEIAEVCGEQDAVLIVDHAFLTAGVHEQIDVATVWDSVGTRCDWISTWDTGKTFGLNEDKLGFIISGPSPRVKTAVDEALAVLQFGVARRQKLFFSELMRRAALSGHVESLRKVCRTNLSSLHECLAPTPLVVRQPSAGSLALVSLAGLNIDDEIARVRLLGAGVGVVAGNVFFHDNWKPRNWIRLALARDPDYFYAAVHTMVTTLCE